MKIEWRQISPVRQCLKQTFPVSGSQRTASLCPGCPSLSHTQFWVPSEGLFDIGGKTSSSLKDLNTKPQLYPSLVVWLVQVTFLLCISTKSLQHTPGSCDGEDEAQRLCSCRNCSCQSRQDGGLGFQKVPSCFSTGQTYF